MQSGWTQIASGESAQSGPFIVEEQNAEDEEDNDDEDEGMLVASNHTKPVLRRLIFLQNQNFVQTEVRLISISAAKLFMTSSRRKKAKKNKKKKAKPVPSDSSVAIESTAPAVANTGTTATLTAFSTTPPVEPRCFDCSYLDPHHRCLLAGLLLTPQTLLSLLSIPVTPITSSLPPSSSSLGNCSLLVGLGGGALPMVLRRFLPGLRQWVCDLDPALLPLARKWFGFDLQKPHCNCLTAEGMAFIGCLRREMLRVAEKVIDLMFCFFF